MLGTLKSWKEDRGYGFITPDDQRFSDLFVHITALQKADIKNVPQPGLRLSFEEGEGRQGKKQAINVAPV